MKSTLSLGISQNFACPDAPRGRLILRRMRHRLACPHPRSIAVLAAVCLVLQLAVCSPLFPLVTALAAWWDGDHSVCVVVRAGEIHLELRHVHGAGTLASSHHHGAATRALVLFSEPNSPSDPDHVFEFASSQPFPRDTRASLRSQGGGAETQTFSNVGVLLDTLPGGDPVLACVLPLRTSLRRVPPPDRFPPAAISSSVILLI